LQKKKKLISNIEAVRSTKVGNTWEQKIHMKIVHVLEPIYQW
jgi:hypothetical protein